MYTAKLFVNNTESNLPLLGQKREIILCDLTQLLDQSAMKVISTSRQTFSVRHMHNLASASLVFRSFAPVSKPKVLLCISLPTFMNIDSFVLLSSFLWFNFVGQVVFYMYIKNNLPDRISFYCVTLDKLIHIFWQFECNLVTIGFSFTLHVLYCVFTCSI